MLGQLNFDEPNLTAISFGNGDSGWDRFAAYILDHNGDISVLCPVVPEDATSPRAVVVDLLSSIEDQIDELEATGVGQPADNSGRVEQSSSGAQQTRWNEKRILQDQWDWITNVFGLSLGGGNGYSSEEATDVRFGSAERRTAGRMRRSSGQGAGERGGRGRGGWVQVSKAEHLHANLPTLQDQVCTVQQSADALAEEISSSATVACSLAHLTGPHGGLVADKDGPLGGSVALARAFTSGHVDVLLLIGGPQPQWAERIDSEGPEERRLMTQSVVVECITLQDAGEASGCGGGGSGGPMLLVDPCDQDTMHVVLPHRIVMLRLKCLEQLRQWCQAVPTKLAAETGQGQGVGGGRQLYSTPAPGARGGLVPDGLGDLEKRQVQVEDGNALGFLVLVNAAAVLATPVLGHLMLTRETGGAMEIINITAVAAQAEAEAKLTSKLQELQPPSSAARLAAAAGDMTQPYQEVLAVACQDIDGALRRSRALMQGVDAAVAGRRVDEGDEAAVTALMQASEALQEGALATLEAAQVAALRRMHVLVDAHQYQHQQLRQLEELLAQAAAKQAALLQKQADVEELSENLLARAAEALSMAQTLQPRRTSAEAAYEAELQRWQSQRARWGQIVQRLKQVATDEAAAEDAALASSGQGLKLTQQQHSTLVALLRDEAQHLQQSSQKLHQVRDGLKGVALS
ncbi:hypothetical protein JKP88DRAFT_327920 [Tribonema minus]|uniref:Uncharacterized protein n=1 Tax=Tribonema minus TaxID=303371 RepID=A0A835YPF7_9STRA|nr:hypothetical protein JKP88DRAFT_327920 [Tribonema minus]